MAARTAAPSVPNHTNNLQEAVVSIETQTGTSGVQGRLWSVNAADGGGLHEPYMEPAYRAGLAALGVGRGTRLLDVGCGAGRALRLAGGRRGQGTGPGAAARPPGYAP